jgi:hypothetical protein
MESSFNIKVFTNTTKQLCICSFISIFLIILFIISPLSNFIKTSAFMKIIIVILLSYTIYLNIFQTNSLKSVINSSISENIQSQLNINIICSYIFTGFLLLLTIYIIKSFF